MTQFLHLIYFHRIIIPGYKYRKKGGGKFYGNIDNQLAISQESWGADKIDFRQFRMNVDWSISAGS